MRNTLDKALYELKEKYGEALCAVYLRGSQMNNLAHEKSDLDLLVVVNTQLRKVLNSGGFSRDYKGSDDNWEYKLVDEYSFVLQVLKGNFLFLDALTRLPLYENKKFSNMSNFLFENQRETFTVNPAGTFNSLLGNARSNVRSLNKLMEFPNEKLLGFNFPGKMFMNVRKSLWQFVALQDLVENKTAKSYSNLLSLVFFEGEKREELMRFKLQEKWESDELVEEMRTLLYSLDEETEGLKSTADKLAQLDSNEEFQLDLLNLVHKPTVGGDLYE